MVRRRLVLTVLAVVMFAAAVVAVGLHGLIPFGLLLAFSVDSDEEESRQPVILTPRNLVLAAAGLAAFAWFWLWHLDLSQRTLVMIAGALIALPLALQESAGDAGRQRTIVVTKRSLILALWGLVVFVYLYYALGYSFLELTAVCGVLPLALAASRAWRARRGQIELGLLRHPLRREVRPHLVQGLNIWLCCGLLGGVVAAGGVHYARIGFSLNAVQFNVVIRGVRRRPGPAGGVGGGPSPAGLPGHQRSRGPAVRLPRSPARPDIHPAHGCDSARHATGRRVVRLERRPQRPTQRSLPEREQRRRLPADGANGRTHTGGADAPLADYPGFGSPVLAPADGRIVEVTDGYADTPPGTNGDHPNNLVVDIGGDRYVVMGHLKQGSVTVQVGDVVHQGQPLAAVGNSGHTNEPHLHLQVQDSPSAREDADRTYPMVFRNVHITRGGPWPWGDSRALRTGDLVLRLEL